MPPAAVPVRDTFCVMLHDVAPCFAAEVDQFSETLAPLVGNTMAAAVVPCWGGTPLTDRDKPFLDRVLASYANIQLHGYEHFRPKGPASSACSRRGKTR